LRHFCGYDLPLEELKRFHTYVFCGDGDLMEGISSEAASLAGHLGLCKLVCLYDDNQATIEGGTELAFTEDVARRFEAYGGHVLRVKDGNDCDAIHRALEEAKVEAGKPSLILCRMVIAFGSPNKQGSCEAHGAPLGPQDVRLTKECLGCLPEAVFCIADKVRAQFRKCINRVARAQAA